MDTIDNEYIWQCRIHSGVRYQKGEVPFPESVKIGLDFNVSSKREEKLDVSLLTNGIMLDICDFAKAVTKAEKYFIYEILDFNFDLGIEIEAHCYDFAARIHNKVKFLRENIKSKPDRWQESFTLPDPKTLKVLPGYCYANFCKTTDKTGLIDGSSNGHVNFTSSVHQKNDSNGALNGEYIIHKPKLRNKLYPFCRKIGLDLDIRPKDTPKQKLDSNLLNNGAMLEVLDFAKMLCGKHRDIVFDLLEHNFSLNLNKISARLQITKLIERRNTGITADLRADFRKEPFLLEPKRKRGGWKKKRVAKMEASEAQTGASKRKRIPKHCEGFVFDSVRATSDSREAYWEEGDLSYMCPVDPEKEMHSGPEDEQENMDMEGCLSEAATEGKQVALLDIKQEEEEISLSPVLSRSPPHSRLSYPHMSRNLSQEAGPGLFSKNMADGDVETLKLRLWKRRAVRTKQILSLSSKVAYKFVYCRSIGLDFNVGFGQKQNIDLRLLTNGVLCEVSKFANAMNKTRGRFVLDILKSNFILDLQDDMLKRNFLFYILTKVKALQSYPYSNDLDFLSSTFQMPEVYNMVDVTNDFPAQEDLTEQETSSDPVSAPAVIQNPDMKPYPFCKKIGLNLWSTEERPESEKLDLSLLSHGTVFEILSFVKELCGTVYQIIYDVLEHNFDLELQNGKTEDAQCIQKWYLTHRVLMKKPHAKQRWFNLTVQFKDPKTKLKQQGPNGHRLKEFIDKQQLCLDRKEKAVKQTDKHSIYPFCREIGLELDIRFKSEPKAKLDLQVLTRGVVYELHHYVAQKSKVPYVKGLYDILEYNFDLSAQSHRRWEFAWSVACQVKAMVGKNRRYLNQKGDYLNKVFELPIEFSRSAQIVCKEEPEIDLVTVDPDDDEVQFVQKLIPVDIEVELE